MKMAAMARFQATNMSVGSHNSCILSNRFKLFKLSRVEPAAAHCRSCGLLSEEQRSQHRTSFVYPLSFSHLAQKKRKKDRKKQRPADTPEDLPAAPGQAIDKSYLCCEHHKAMVAGLALLRNPEMLLGEGVATALHGGERVRSPKPAEPAALQFLVVVVGRRKHAHACLSYS